MRKGRQLFSTILILAFSLALAGCAGTGEKKQHDPDPGMLEPMDPPSGNKARDQYNEMLRDEQEELGE